MDDLGSPFAAFFDEHYASVCRGLTAALGDSSRAEEAAQEAFTRAYVRWRRVSAMDRPAGWVYVTAVRYARRRRGEPTVAAAEAQVRDVAELVVDRQRVASVLASLPERQRLAVVLRYGLDLSLDEVAAAMGCALGTVKSTLHGALARMHVSLDDPLEEVTPDGRR